MPPKNNNTIQIVSEGIQPVNIPKGTQPNQNLDTSNPPGSNSDASISSNDSSSSDASNENSSFNS